MRINGFGDDGTIDDLPWASVFDPAANARALSAIQAEGFRAASRIVDRFVRAVDSRGDGQPPVSGAPEEAGGAANGGVGVSDLERLTRAWWSMAGQFLLRAMPVGGASGGPPVALDVCDPDSSGSLTLQAAAGGSAGAEVWLHNTEPADRADIRLRCSELLSHDGEVIGADAVRIDPELVPMPRRSSRGVAISVDLAPQVTPGVYRGTLLATGQPPLWLPVVLTVHPPEA